MSPRKKADPLENHDQPEEPPEQTNISIFDYDAKKFTEIQNADIKKCLELGKKKSSVTWINIYGLEDTKTLESLAEKFGLHPLVIEDILQTDQRPKVEDYDSYIYTVVRMLDFNEKKMRIENEQVSIILSDSFVISVQEKQGDIFDRIRDSIRKDKGKIRKMRYDFLTYSLLDAIVDNYFLILEKLGTNIEKIEDEIMESPSPKTIQKIHKLKKQMVSLRKSVWPMREVVNALERESRESSPLIGKGTVIYLRDLYDHIIQLIDTVETYRDLVSGMIDVYLSTISNKLNEVMKVLTVIATIFIPLTFITGIYGMNFKYMPELDHPLGYLIVLLFMLMLGLFMFAYFKKKRWI